MNRVGCVKKWCGGPSEGWRTNQFAGNAGARGKELGCQRVVLLGRNWAN